MFLAVGYAPFPLVTRGPWAAFVPIFLSEVEQEQRPSGNGDREAIVVGAGLCDGEGERAYSVYDPILGEKYLIYFKRSAGAKSGYTTICRNPICRTWRTLCQKIFGKLSLSQFSANCLSANCPVSRENIEWSEQNQSTSIGKWSLGLMPFGSKSFG